jgi:hypothetical protein
LGCDCRGVVSSSENCRQQNVGLFTIDHGSNNAMDMAKGGNKKGVVADLPYLLRESLVKWVL